MPEIKADASAALIVLREAVGYFIRLETDRFAEAFSKDYERLWSYLEGHAKQAQYFFIMETLIREKLNELRKEQLLFDDKVRAIADFSSYLMVTAEFIALKHPLPEFSRNDLTGHKLSTRELFITLRDKCRSLIGCNLSFKPLSIRIFRLRKSLDRKQYSQQYSFLEDLEALVK